jgi:histone H3/H4
MVTRVSGSGPVIPPEDGNLRSAPFVKAMRQFSSDINSPNPDLDRIARDVIETYNRAIETKA